MLAKPVSATLEIKRSVFIANLAPVTDEGQAREFIAAKRHQYGGARHNCTAYIIDQENLTPIARSNDDGEPAGTAGMPMLEVMRGAQVTNTVAVVTRYFGGIKLGTGGLVRAYGDAVQAALAAGRLLGRKRFAQGIFSADPATVARLFPILEASGCQVDVQWLDPAVVTLRMPVQAWDGIVAEVGEQTRGQVEVRREADIVQYG